MATKKFSPAQIAAQKLFAERARAGTLGKGKRKPNPGLYDNVNAKRARIAAGSGERMRKPGSKGAPTQEAFEQSAMTAKRNPATKSNDIYVVQFEAFPGNFQDAGAFVKGIPLYFKSLESAKKAAKKVSNTVTFNDDEVRIVKIDKPKEFLQSYRDMGYFDRKTNPDKSKPRAYVMRASQATGRPPVKGTKAGNRLITRRKKALSAPAGYFPNPMMTAAQVQRVKQALKESETALSRATRYSPENQDKGLIDFYQKHIAKLKKSMETGKFPSDEKFGTGRKTNPAATMMTGYQVICMHPKKHVVGIFKTMAEAKLVARAMADAKGVAYGVKTVKVHKAHFAV